VTSTYALEAGFLALAGGTVSETLSDASSGLVDFGTEASEPRRLHAVPEDLGVRARFDAMAERARERRAHMSMEPDTDEHARRQLEITVALTAGQQQALGLE
jgi:hypothetical protein